MVCNAGTRSFRLSRDGGAVMLQNPDGTERLMLFVSDLQRAKQDLQKREQEAASRREESPDTYQVSCLERMLLASAGVRTCKALRAVTCRPHC